MLGREKWSECEGGQKAFGIGVMVPTAHSIALIAQNEGERDDRRDTGCTRFINGQNRLMVSWFFIGTLVS
jgi:hypothetical protein